MNQFLHLLACWLQYSWLSGRWVCLCVYICSSNCHWICLNILLVSSLINECLWHAFIYICLTVIIYLILKWCICVDTYTDMYTRVYTHICTHVFTHMRVEISWDFLGGDSHILRLTLYLWVWSFFFFVLNKAKFGGWEKLEKPRG